MPRYKDYNHKQNAMVVIHFKEQIQPGTFEHAVHYLTDNKLDLIFFDEIYKNDRTGRITYDPAILLKIILFAYSEGITSSRKIAWCCRNNIIFITLSCQTSPRSTTITNFISTHTLKQLKNYLNKFF